MLMICSKLGVCFCPSVLSPNFLDSAVIHALISGAVVDYLRGLAFSALSSLRDNSKWASGAEHAKRPKWSS